MSLARVATRSRNGLNATLIWVETHLSQGLPAIVMVGISESVVRDAKERVRSAIISSGFRWPDSRLTISFSPASALKTGASFDLPIAVSILLASKQLPDSLAQGTEFYGELSLDGRVLATTGLLAAGASERDKQVTIFTPKPNAMALAPFCSRVVGLGHLSELRTPDRLSESDFRECSPARTNGVATTYQLPAGQASLWRAAEIAAAGGHHLLMSGEPGAGKTMTAGLIRQLLPDPSDEEMLESQILFDIANKPCPSHRPFRSPHHSISLTGLVGGTRHATPGEISLAHHGILFLDELPEFSLATIEALRQPLEAGHIQITRAEQSHLYPAKFQLIAAMNPCPCGYRGSSETACRCSSSALARYDAKLSGPLLDRIDMFIRVSRSKLSDVMAPQTTQYDRLERVRQSVLVARESQIVRQGQQNSLLPSSDVLDSCSLPGETKKWLESTGERLKLSGRSLHRCLRVARTIADLTGAASVSQTDLTEALAYRIAIKASP